MTLPSPCRITLLSVHIAASFYEQALNAAHIVEPI
jgi:hypothetical protein